MNLSPTATLLLATLIICLSAAEDIDFWAVDNLPLGCKASLRHSEYFGAKLKTFECEAAGLSEIPAEIPSDSQVVRLRGNRISGLTGLSGQLLPDLLQLDLSHNNLSGAALQYDWPVGLKLLDLHGNTRLSGNLPDFSGLTGLVELDLSECRLADSDVNGDQKFPAGIQILRLSGNRLTTVSPTVALRSLISLDLSANRLYRIPADLAPLGRLETLRLDNNRLTAVPIFSPATFPRLKSLSLGENLISRLNAGSFAGLPRLAHVSLAGSARLRMVDTGAFDSLPALLVVHLHDCPQLSYFDSAAIQNCPALSHLLLHNANLTDVADLTVSLPNLHHLSIYSNPLACGCHSRWLTVAAEADRLVCDSPAHLRFRLWASLSPADFAPICRPKLFTPEASRIAPEGGDVQLDCRAVGLPAANLVWLSPDGVKLASGATLLLRSVRLESAGRYVCADPAGQFVSVDLKVSRAPLKIWPIRVGRGEVLLGLSGATRPQRLFVRSGPNGRHVQAGLISPAMRSIRLSRLPPATPVEICLADQTHSGANEILTGLTCCHLVTPQSADQSIIDWDPMATVKSTNLAVGAALAVAASLLLAVGLATVWLQRRRQTQIGAKRPFLHYFDVGVEPNFYAKLPITPNTPATPNPAGFFNEFLAAGQYATISCPAGRHLSTATDVTDVNDE